MGRQARPFVTRVVLAHPTQQELELLGLRRVLVGFPRLASLVGQAGLQARVHEQQSGPVVERGRDQVRVTALDDTALSPLAERTHTRNGLLWIASDSDLAHLPGDRIQVQGRAGMLLRQLTRDGGLTRARVSEDHELHGMGQKS
ncbi:MAG: hypothetical protein ACI8QZ_003440 [Chlamydiales bacterium]